MRTIRLVALAFVLTVFSAAVFANNEPTVAKKDSKIYQQVRTEVSGFIQNPELKKNGIKEEEVKVRFKLNAEKKIEILNVQSESDYLKNFVEKNMNHQNVKVDGIKSNEIYEVIFAFILR